MRTIEFIGPAPVWSEATDEWPFKMCKAPNLGGGLKTMLRLPHMERLAHTLQSLDYDSEVKQHPADIAKAAVHLIQDVEIWLEKAKKAVK